MTWPSFTDVPEVVARARVAGVQRILTAGTDLASSNEAIRLAERYPEVFAAVGVHPNDVREDDGLEAIRVLAGHERVVAIGETGLDYYRDWTAPALQRRSFDAHLAIAADCKLPIVIHNREADDDVLAAVAPYKGRVRGVLHCFSGDRARAARGLELGLHLSFAGNLTYPSAGALREVAGWAPADRLLVETDAPFLSPAPHRGRRNEPGYVDLTLRALAACREVDVGLLARQVAENARVLFAW